MQAFERHVTPSTLVTSGKEAVLEALSHKASFLSMAHLKNMHKDHAVIFVWLISLSWVIYHSLPV